MEELRSKTTPLPSNRQSWLTTGPCRDDVGVGSSHRDDRSALNDRTRHELANFDKVTETGIQPVTGTCFEDLATAGTGWVNQARPPLDPRLYTEKHIGEGRKGGKRAREREKTKTNQP